MRIQFHQQFKRHVERLNPKQQRELESRLRLFAANKFDSKLDDHSLKGKWSGYRSISVSGDLRANYYEAGKNHVIFVDIGTQHQLYGK